MPKYILLFGIVLFYSALAESSNVFTRTADRSDSRMMSMCLQAQDVLNLMKRYDSGLDYEIKCESESFYEARSLFGPSRDHEKFNISATFSGSVDQSCLSKSGVESYRLIKIKPLIFGYRSSNGMPTGVNPYLNNMLEKLGVESQLVILDTGYQGGMAPIQKVIYYPYCH